MGWSTDQRTIWAVVYRKTADIASAFNMRAKDEEQPISRMEKTHHPYIVPKNVCRTGDGETAADNS